MGFYLVLLWFARVLLGFTGFYRVSPGFTGFYWVLLGFTMMESSPMICLSLSVSFTVTAMFVFFVFFSRANQGTERVCACIRQRRGDARWTNGVIPVVAAKIFKKNKQSRTKKKLRHRGNECNLDDFCEFFFWWRNDGRHQRYSVTW